MWISGAHDSTSSKASCSLPGAWTKWTGEDGRGRVMLPGFRGLRGDLGKGGKTSFTKVKLCRTGKLNRTICRIGIFFSFPLLKNLCVWDIWLLGSPLLLLAGLMVSCVDAFQWLKGQNRMFATCSLIISPTRHHMECQEPENSASLFLCHYQIQKNLDLVRLIFVTVAF